MTEYKRIERPPNGWCSELHKQTPANRALEYFLAFCWGTCMIPLYILKGYFKAFERVPSSKD